MSDSIPVILLADDNRDDCFLFKEALSEMKANVHLITAEDGNALIELLKNSTLLPDFILLDINMPFKSGKECVAEIRGDQTFMNVPVVIYSTSLSPRDIDESYKAGANLYLQKPHSFSDLMSLISKLLELDWSKHKPHPDKGMFILSTDRTTFYN